MKRFTIKEISEITQIKAHTLRYYESIGLIDGIEKNGSGNRSYTEADLEWIKFIKKAKHTRMKIDKILEYADLRRVGKSTSLERKKILEEHLLSIENEITSLIETKKYIEYKIKIYSDNLNEN
jgi:DNA-binding transcriptional MerR regulator